MTRSSKNFKVTSLAFFYSLNVIISLKSTTVSYPSLLSCPYIVPVMVMIIAMLEETHASETCAPRQIMIYINNMAALHNTSMLYVVAMTRLPAWV